MHPPFEVDNRDLLMLAEMFVADEPCCNCFHNECIFLRICATQ